jgi:hypothetical protein
MAASGSRLVADNAPRCRVFISAPQVYGDQIKSLQTNKKIPLEALKA